MADILFVHACPRPDSRTMRLAEALLSSLSGEVERVDLYSFPLPPLDSAGLEMRHAAARDKDFSSPYFALAKQFAQAETVVIAAPYWDLLFPAVLRSYLEAVSVAGISFVYTESGRPMGLCRAKTLYYVTTAGGVIGQNDWGCRYLEALAEGLFGIPEVRCISAEGLDMAPERAEAILQHAISEIGQMLAPRSSPCGDDSQKEAHPMPIAPAAHTAAFEA